MKADFNMRLKQILFNSIVSVYYGAIVPCLFAQVYKNQTLCNLTFNCLVLVRNRINIIDLLSIMIYCSSSFRVLYIMTLLGSDDILYWFGLGHSCFT